MKLIADIELIVLFQNAAMMKHRDPLWWEKLGISMWVLFTLDRNDVSKYFDLQGRWSVNHRLVRAYNNDLVIRHRFENAYHMVCGY